VFYSAVPRPATLSKRQIDKSYWLGPLEALTLGTERENRRLVSLKTRQDEMFRRRSGIDCTVRAVLRQFAIVGRAFSAARAAV